MTETITQTEEVTILLFEYERGYKVRFFDCGDDGIKVELSHATEEEAAIEIPPDETAKLTTGLRRYLKLRPPKEVMPMR